MKLQIFDPLCVSRPFAINHTQPCHRRRAFVGVRIFHDSRLVCVHRCVYTVRRTPVCVRECVCVRVCACIRSQHLNRARSTAWQNCARRARGKERNIDVTTRRASFRPHEHKRDGENTSRRNHEQSRREKKKNNENRLRECVRHDFVCDACVSELQIGCEYVCVRMRTCTNTKMVFVGSRRMRFAEWQSPYNRTGLGGQIRRKERIFHHHFVFPGFRTYETTTTTTKKNDEVVAEAKSTG